MYRQSYALAPARSTGRRDYRMKGQLLPLMARTCLLRHTLFRSLSAKIGQDSPRPQRVATLSPIQPMITLTTDKAARSSCGVAGNLQGVVFARVSLSEQYPDAELFDYLVGNSRQSCWKLHTRARPVEQPAIRSLTPPGISYARTLAPVRRRSAR
jgi:hypothetical protein